MSEKLSRRMFIGELIIFGLPSSLLIFVTTTGYINSFIKYLYFGWHDAAYTLFSLLAFTAIISGLIISRAFIRKDVSKPNNSEPILWILSFLGILLFITASISLSLAPPVEYESRFRYDFENFSLGLPMLIPLLHLFLERLLRKEKRAI